MTAPTLGTQLRDIREAAGFSLGHVEATSGGNWMSAAIGAWERGQRRPPLQRLDEYLHGMYGLRIAFVPATLSDSHQKLANWIAAQDVSDAEVRAAVALVRAAREQQVPALNAVA